MSFRDYRRGGFRYFLEKSLDVVRNPGAHGSHRWYINRLGKPVYGDPPSLRRHPFPVGHTWEAEELPDHHWYQGAASRYLLAPTGDVLRYSEGAAHTLQEKEQYEPRQVPEKFGLKGADDLIHIGRALQSGKAGTWQGTVHRYEYITSHKLSDEARNTIETPTPPPHTAGRLAVQKWIAAMHDRDLQAHVLESVGYMQGTASQRPHKDDGPYTG